MTVWLEAITVSLLFFLLFTLFFPPHSSLIVKKKKMELHITVSAEFVR